MGISTVLVTGSSGTVGTALCKALLEEGYDVTGADIHPNRWSNRIDEHTSIVDLEDEGVFDVLPESVDLVIHLAANARVHKLVKNPNRAKENFDTTFNVLEYARNVGADFIFSSMETTVRLSMTRQILMSMSVKVRIQQVRLEVKHSSSHTMYATI
jgi:UDP-glucose 4-epimerase